MNFVKKLKNIVNDIIPNEIKNNDYVKGALLAANPAQLVLYLEVKGFCLVSHQKFYYKEVM